MKKPAAVHVRTDKQVIERRVLAVVDRLDVAFQGRTYPGTPVAQGLHAFDFALRGPHDRDDDDYLQIHPEEALALVRALLPFFAAARRRPGVEQ